MWNNLQIFAARDIAVDIDQADSAGARVERRLLAHPADHFGWVGEKCKHCLGPGRDMQLALQHIRLLLCHLAEASVLPLRPPASGAAADHPRTIPEMRADPPALPAELGTAAACHLCAREPGPPP